MLLIDANLFLSSSPSSSQHAHLAAAQPAVQPIQAAQPVPQAAMPPQAQPQYDYSAYAGMRFNF